MVPKRRTMLLVACAIGARTSLVACNNESGCMGFYAADDAAPIDATAQDTYVNGCLGFYMYDGPYDVAFEAESDASADDSSDATDANTEPADSNDE